MPRRSLRGLRGRVTLLFTLFAIASIAGLTGSGALPVLERLDLSDPGPLSGAHARFTEQTGCVTCHGRQDRSGLAWLGEVFAGHDMSGACLDCHSFDGPADRAHNADLTPVHGPATLECVACHSEHQGEAFDIARLSDEKCHSCHKDEFKFASFGRDHPSFGENFPYDAPAAIKFTHVQHLTKHFPSKGDNRAEAETCLSCHDIDRAERNVPVFSFESMCAGCHDDQISRKDLVLLTLPEFEVSLVALTEEEVEAFESQADTDELLPVQILESCGADFEELEILEANLEARSAGEEPEEEDDFLSIGEDEPTPVGSFLLAIDPEDMESYWVPYRTLIHAMTQDGAGALQELVEQRFGQGAAAALLAGLESLPLEDLACAWAGNEEFEPEDDVPEGPGWTAEALEIRYKPAGHEDPIAQAWLEVAAAAAAADTSNEIAETFNGFMHSEEQGPGTCAYCHSAMQSSADENDGIGADASKAPLLTASLQWEPRPTMRHQVRYAHGPHINLLGPGTWCTSCHELDKATKIEANSDPGGSNEQGLLPVGGFTPITIAKCQSCHVEGGVRQDCLTCHLYHRGVAFRKRMF